MHNQEEQWIDDVMNSMSEAQRARPRNDLFEDIIYNLDNTPNKTMTLGLWKYAVAAAIALLILNIFAASQFTRDTHPELEVINGQTSIYNPIVSNYDIYEE